MVSLPKTLNSKLPQKKKKNGTNKVFKGLSETSQAIPPPSAPLSYHPPHSHRGAHEGLSTQQLFSPKLQALLQYSPKTTRSALSQQQSTLRYSSCPGSLFVALEKYWPKQLLFPLTGHSPSLRSQGRNWGRDAEGTLLTGWLLGLTFCYLSGITQDHPPRCGTTHSDLGPPTAAMRQENSHTHTNLSMGQCDEGNSQLRSSLPRWL